MATHKAWRLHAHNDLRFDDVETPKPAPDGVLVRIEAGMVLSYMGRVLSGSIPYSLPPMPFVPGTNAIARVIAAGDNVGHVRSGDRVFLSPHLRGDVPDPEPPQILIGLTATVTTPAALAMQMRWRDGVFAEIAHWPAACVTPLAGLERGDAGGRDGRRTRGCGRAQARGAGTFTRSFWPARDSGCCHRRHA
jgi:alcohol dehydrogenase